VPHHYFFERPRALQYTYLGERISYGEDAAPISHEISSASDLKYTAEGVAKARERIDLFIDLVWVGIISNLSEVFSEVYFAPHQSAGKAFLMFIVVFLPAWRIWNFLREFLSQ
jgi:low temperature requirement protein LtrA